MNRHGFSGDETSADQMEHEGTDILPKRAIRCNQLRTGGLFPLGGADMRVGNHRQAVWVGFPGEALRVEAGTLVRVQPATPSPSRA